MKDSREVMVSDELTQGGATGDGHCVIERAGWVYVLEGEAGTAINSSTSQRASVSSRYSGGVDPRSGQGTIQFIWSTLKSMACRSVLVRSHSGQSERQDAKA